MIMERENQGTVMKEGRSIVIQCDIHFRKSLKSRKTIITV